MKFSLLGLTLMVGLCSMTQHLSAQIIFKETFGQTQTRQMSPYMPAGSYGWGDPNGALDVEKEIENNYYAVVTPSHVRDAWPPYAWWFWTGPLPVGNTAGGAGNPATDDHTGDVDGAVMVVNAGTTLNGFYSRLANLTPGNSYRLSMWIYLVNASSIFSMEVRDPIDNSVLGSINSPFLSTTGSWQQYSFDFSIPAGCTNGGQVRVYLANAFSALGGNDYYVDDIQLEQLIGVSGTPINCPSGVALPLNRIEVSALPVQHDVQLSWTADDVSDATAFIVQRSLDGKGFENVHTETLAAGSDVKSFQFIDRSAASGKLYYRVAGQKKSGAIVYSSIITVVVGNSVNGLRVFPVPAKKGEVISMEVTASGPGTCVVYTITGMPVRSYPIQGTQVVTLKGLSAGQYILKLIDQHGSSSSVARLVVE